MSATSITKWKLSGDFFDFCKCNIPCPCTFAQTPTYGDCEDVLAYHTKSGHYGETSLDDLNLLALSYFKGNIWEGNTKANIASFVDSLSPCLNQAWKIYLRTNSPLRGIEEWAC
jgi:hypothetical protein